MRSNKKIKDKLKRKKEIWTRISLRMSSVKKKLRMNSKDNKRLNYNQRPYIRKISRIIWPIFRKTQGIKKNMKPS